MLVFGSKRQKLEPGKAREPMLKKGDVSLDG